MGDRKYNPQQRTHMLKVDRAILHVFDFDSGSTYLSERPLDLTVRATRSFVQRHLRKISSNAESRHGAFAPDSGFAAELQRYLVGEREFVEFSTEIAQWFWEELRRAEDLEQCDLLVADFTDTDASDEKDVEFDGPAGRRFFSILLLPRRQAFVHEVAGDANDIARVDATLPNPSQKVASYVLVDAESGVIDFHDKERAVGGEKVMVIPERFLQRSTAGLLAPRYEGKVVEGALGKARQRTECALLDLVVLEEREILVLDNMRHRGQDLLDNLLDARTSQPELVSQFLKRLTMQAPQHDFVVPRGVRTEPFLCGGPLERNSVMLFVKRQIGTPLRKRLCRFEPVRPLGNKHYCI